VWLDRGELDKILDRSHRDAAAFAFPHRIRRKRSFLNDLFED
jgi:Zn-finger nucleic acid-binding protein